MAKHSRSAVLTALVLLLALTIVTLTLPLSGSSIPNELSETNTVSLPEARSNLSLSSEASLKKRQCWTQVPIPTRKEDYVCDNSYPSKEEIVEQMRLKMMISNAFNAAVFYTGWPSLNTPTAVLDGAAWIKENEPLVTGAVYFFNVLPGGWHDAVETHLRATYATTTSSGVRPFNLCVSEALADETTFSSSYVVMPWTHEPLPDSVWWTTEYPALTQNPRIQKIYRLDPRSPQNGGPCDTNAKLLWSREKGDPARDALVPCRRYRVLHYANPDRNPNYDPTGLEMGDVDDTDDSWDSAFDDDDE